MFSYGVVTEYDPCLDVNVYHGDCLRLMNELYEGGELVDLVVTSPPYNMGREYESDVSLENYIESQRQVIGMVDKVLSQFGSVCWQVGHYIDGASRSKEAYPLDILLYPIFKDFGFNLRNRIVWTFGHGLHDKIRFSGRHETILWFTRDVEDYTFNLDPVRVPQKYPSKKHYKGKNKGKLSGNPLGKNPSDVWNMPNVKSNHREKTDHPCQFPIGLAERLILSLSNDGDVVLDPFLGSGTTAVAGMMRSRKVIGCEIQEKYINIALNRLSMVENGSVPYRPMNKKVYNPKSKNADYKSSHTYTDQITIADLIDENDE